MRMTSQLQLHGHSAAPWPCAGILPPLARKSQHTHSRETATAMAQQRHGLAALGTLQAPSGARDLVRFEESLIEHLSRFSAALEAEVDRLADKLENLENGVAGVEQGMGRIDRELSRMHAVGQVRMLPVDHSSLQPRAQPGPKVPQSASSGARQPWNGLQQPGTGGVLEEGGGFSQADVEAILLGMSNMNLPLEAGPMDPRELWLPPPLISQGRVQGPGRGRQSQQAAHSSSAHQENGGISQGRNQEHGAGAGTASVAPGELGRDEDEAGSAYAGVEGEDALFSAAEHGGQADQTREERLWRVQPGGHGQPTGWQIRGAEWEEPAMAPFRKEQEPSSGDLLEPSASAVRGFRALLEAALRAPGAFGDDEQWAAPQGDEDLKDSALSASDDQWPQDGEGVGEGDWLGREDSPNGTSLGGGASGFLGDQNDEDR